jgi:cytochrome c oxidase assembly protein subunit 15
MTNDPNNPGSPRWLHALAVLTVLCTLPLLFLGAGVTSHGVGMVDPRGFRPPWEIVNGLFENSGLAWRLEYGHRTFGFLVGLCGIGLAVGCWFYDPRPWMGWIGVLALALICVQGALGILRVNLNASYPHAFALVHGVFAQVVFAVLVSVTLLTSRRWADDPTDEARPTLKVWSIVTALLVFGQLLFGGMVRHHDSLLGPRGHLLGAFIVVAAVVWLLKLIRESQARERFAVARILFMALLGLQLLLGMESWLAKYYVGTAVSHEPLLPVPMHAEWIRTAHYVVGSLIFATSVSVALMAQRRPALAMEAAPEPSRELEGAL